MRVDMQKFWLAFLLLITCQTAVWTQTYTSADSAFFNECAGLDSESVVNKVYEWVVNKRRNEYRSLVIQPGNIITLPAGKKYKARLGVRSDMHLWEVSAAFANAYVIPYLATTKQTGTAQYELKDEWKTKTVKIIKRIIFIAILALVVLLFFTIEYKVIKKISSKYFGWKKRRADKKAAAQGSP